MSEWKIHLTPGVRLVDCDPIERALWSRHRTQGGTMNDEVLADIGRILDLVDRGGGREHPPAACSLCRGDMEALRRLRDLVTPSAEPPSRNDWQRAVAEGHTIDGLDGWTEFELRCREMDADAPRFGTPRGESLRGHLKAAREHLCAAQPQCVIIADRSPLQQALDRIDYVAGREGVDPGDTFATADVVYPHVPPSGPTPVYATAENPGPFGRSEDYPL